MENFNRKSLREIYPQKYCFKMLCRLMYWFGCGDFWYEETERSSLERRLYPIWAFLSNALLTVVIFDEYLAYTRTDLTEKEQNDLVQHTLGHSSISSKIVLMYLQKKQIKIVLKRFLEENRSTYSSSALDKAAMWKSIKFCGMVALVSLGTVWSAQMDRFRAHLTEGIPIGALVTFYPTRAHSGTLVSVLRFFIEFYWTHLVTIMSFVDAVAICSLVFVEAKFKLLQLYFEDLGNILKDNKSNTSEEEFKERFIDGIKMHEHALWSATNIQSAIGTIYSIQIFESLSLLVMCLIKLVSSVLSPMLLLANMVYIICVIVITGTYMMTAGDITHEASMLSTSMFHCGWEAHRKMADLRPLAVLALQRSQVPVYMTAFGIIKLSYVNFISVLRSSYSFFAVMY